MGTESGDINVTLAAGFCRCSEGLLAGGSGRFLESGFLIGAFFGNGCESIHRAIWDCASSDKLSKRAPAIFFEGLFQTIQADDSTKSEASGN
jgi:hypothetical protein